MADRAATTIVVDLATGAIACNASRRFTASELFVAAAAMLKAPRQPCPCGSCARTEAAMATAEAALDGAGVSFERSVQGVRERLQ